VKVSGNPVGLLCSGDIISIYPADFEAEETFYNGVIFHDGNFNYG
jgi:hypothetical protein